MSKHYIWKWVPKDYKHSWKSAPDLAWVAVAAKALPGDLKLGTRKIFGFTYSVYLTGVGYYAK